LVNGTSSWLPARQPFLIPCRVSGFACPALEEIDMKWLAHVAIITLFTTPAWAQEPARQAPPADIAKVVSIEVPAGGCAVVEAKMTYLDSQGQPHSVTYLRQGSDCFDH